MEYKLIFTDEKNEDFIKLYQELNEYFISEFGNKAINFVKKNSIKNKLFVVLVYNNTKNAIGCGAFEELSNESVEIKKVYVKKEYRNKSVGTIIIKTLEQKAKNIGKETVYLEVGIKMVKSKSFYKNLGYKLICPCEFKENSLNDGMKKRIK